MTPAQKKRIPFTGNWSLISRIIPLFAFLILTACETKKTLTSTDTSSGVVTIREVIISRGDTLSHGITAVMDENGDTLTAKRYDEDRLVEEMEYFPQDRIVRAHNYEDGFTTVWQRDENRLFSRKVLRGDSIVSWDFYDESGKVCNRKAWHKKQSRHYYGEYLKYMKIMGWVPDNFRIRALFIPAQDRPGMIDITSHGTVRLYLFDYDRDKFELKHVNERSKKWVKYNTQLHIRNKQLPGQLKKKAESVMKGQTALPDITLDSCADSCDLLFLLFNNGASRKFMRLHPERALGLVSSWKALSGYDEAAGKIDEKLEKWQTEVGRDYFLEEILKLPYAVE